MRRSAMQFERSFVGINLDQQKKRRVFHFLMNVEAVAAGFRVDTDARVAQKPFAEFFHYVLMGAQMSGVKDGHAIHRTAADSAG